MKADPRGQLTLYDSPIRVKNSFTIRQILAAANQKIIFPNWKGDYTDLAELTTEPRVVASGC